VSETVPITQTRRRLALRLLSDDDVRRVHEAAVGLLGAEGVAAEAATGSAPSAVTLAGRVPDHDVTLHGTTSLLAAGAGPAAKAGGAGVSTHTATADDLSEACRLADALPEVAVVAGPPLLPAGTGLASAVAVCAAATSKHLQLVAPVTDAEAGALVAMAAAIAGSAGEARRRPPLSLRAAAGALEPALRFARAGLPVALVLPPADGPAGDGGLAAALVRRHAGVLAACAAVQMAAPGAPFLYEVSPAVTGGEGDVAPAGPEAIAFQLAAAQLAARVGLPAVATSLATASPASDWQACTENASASLAATTGGVALVSGAGTLGGGEVFSLQGLVMDAEVFSWNAFIAAGIEVSDETIALDTIRDVDICGNFLGQRHTRRHMREVWRPCLLDRSMWDAWIASGREGAPEKAAALAAELLGAHAPAPLDDEVRRTLERIIAEAGL
jgi:trimethylamine--corrinoid protein Co-methyltransferase